VVNKIVSLMTVPLVQGSLRYAYKIGEVPSDRSAKNQAEGATFSAAVLPLVEYCNPASASLISSALKLPAAEFDATNGPFPDYAAVKAAFEATYPCLGITCAHVGSIAAAFPACISTTASKSTGSFTVGATITAAGTVEDFAADKILALECAMASVAGVTCPDVTLEVVAASVLLRFTIVVADNAAANLLVTSLRDHLSSAEAAAALLGNGVTIELVGSVAVGGDATPTVSSPPSSPPSSPEKGGNNLWILGPILGPLGCLCGLIGGICYYQKKKKAKAAHRGGALTEMSAREKV